jgi:membrane protease YdiL (CAAX protease family)
MENPWLLGGMIVAGAVVAKWWVDDLRAHGAGAPRPGSFPGATPASPKALAIAATGAVALVALETLGESALGLTDRQSRITVLFGLYTLVAAFVEELVFRGYVVVERRGPVFLWGGVVLASALFAVLHPFLWAWQDGGLRLQLDAKGWFSTGAIFVSSLWFYAMRFLPANPTRSLLPCIAAHLARNAAVFAIKGALGFVREP